MMPSTLFPAGHAYMAVPDWDEPRLIVPARSAIERWNALAFYPAFRLRARLFKHALRTVRTVAPGERRVINQTEDSALLRDIADVLPGVETVTALVGTPGPAQKIVLQVRDAGRAVCGYVKVGRTDTARERIRREYGILRKLHPGLGPTPLKLVTWPDADLLVMSSVPGQRIPAALPPTDHLLAFLARLETAGPVPADRHPWFQRLGPVLNLDQALDVLSARPWPVVIQHGDLVPWNLRREGEQLHAFDWEYAELESIPYLDLAFYLLQTAFLIYGWSADRATAYTARYLHEHPHIGLSEREARAVCAVSAADAHAASERDGHQEDFPIQGWRRQIMEIAG